MQWVSFKVSALAKQGENTWNKSLFISWASRSVDHCRAKVQRSSTSLDAMVQVIVRVKEFGCMVKSYLTKKRLFLLLYCTKAKATWVQSAWSQSWDWLFKEAIRHQHKLEETTRHTANSILTCQAVTYTRSLTQALLNDLQFSSRCVGWHTTH